MAGSYNKVLLMGNLTRDIEVRQLPNSSNSVANIGLAVNRRYAAANGVNREEVTFVDCEAWGKIAELMNQYLKKGSPIFIEGRLKLDQWEDKEGGKRSKLKVVVENFQFIDSGGGGAGGEGGGSGAGGERSYSRAPAASSGRGGASADAGNGGGGGGAGSGGGQAYEPIGEEDIPF